MKVVELNLTEEDLKKMSTDDFIELLKQAGIEVEEEGTLQKDVEMLKANSTMPYTLYAALERVNAFMNKGAMLNVLLEIEDDETIKHGVEVINECMRQHAEEFKYDYVLELKRR